MLSEVQTLTLIMNQVNRLAPQYRLRLVQLTLDTLIEPTTRSFFKPTVDIEGKKIGFIVCEVLQRLKCQQMKSCI